MGQTGCLDPRELSDSSFYLVWGSNMKATRLQSMPALIRARRQGKRVVLIDDSLVRGTTSRYIVQLLKEASAKEVHLRIASPAIIYPCFYGVDTSTQQELISYRLSSAALREYVGADSLRFLSLEDLQRACGGNCCFACFNGEYVTPLYCHGEKSK